MDLSKSLASTKPTVNEDDMKKLDKFTLDFGQEAKSNKSPKQTDHQKLLCETLQDCDLKTKRILSPRLNCT
jgi:Vps4 C terminal oligomerisation domain